MGGIGTRFWGVWPLHPFGRPTFFAADRGGEKSDYHYTKRSGRMWIRIFPDTPISKKPSETRMGGGKSPVDHFAAIVKPGRMIFELSGVPEERARGALERAARKLPVKTRIIVEE